MSQTLTPVNKRVLVRMAEAASRPLRDEVQRAASDDEFLSREERAELVLDAVSALPGQAALMTTMGEDFQRILTVAGAPGHLVKPYCVRVEALVADLAKIITLIREGLDLFTDGEVRGGALAEVEKVEGDLKAAAAPFLSVLELLRRPYPTLDLSRLATEPGIGYEEAKARLQAARK